MLYITNGNKLWSWDGTTARDSGTGTLTLPTGWVITAYEILNNRIYLAAVQATTSSNTSFNTPVKIFVWDGYSTSYIDEKKISTGVITAMKEMDGLIYFFANSSLYAFDGSSYGKKKYIGVAVTKHNISVSSGKLYFPITGGIGCYDSIYKSYSAPIKTSKSVSILKIGWGSSIDLITTEGKAYRCSSNNDITSFYSNYYSYALPIYIRKIDILFQGTLSSGATYDVKLLDEKGTAVNTKTISYAVDTAIVKKSYRLNYNLDYWRLQVDFNNAANAAIVWIKIYFDDSQLDITK